MADTVSSSDLQPSAKRRRLNPAAIVPVPVYSSRVSRGLQLKPAACLIGGRQNPDDCGHDSLWAELNPRRPAVVELSDSEEEPEPGRFRSKPAENQLGRAGVPSPPLPESPVQKQSSKALRKIRPSVLSSEINRKLRAVSSGLSPDRRIGRRRTRRNQRAEPSDDGDDVIIVSPEDGSDSPREIPLKIRCRTDVHKVLVLPSTRLSEVLGRLAAILEVPPPRLLLLREELELPAGATVGQLGLGIADILDCEVMPEEEQSSSSCISLKLQSRDRTSSQLFFVHREAPLSSVFSQYRTRFPAGASESVRFLFDGSKVADSQTAAQLELEDGDIIEVWT